MCSALKSLQGVSNLTWVSSVFKHLCISCFAQVLDGVPKRALSGYEDGGAPAPSKPPQAQATPHASSVYRNPTFTDQSPRRVNTVAEGPSVPHSQSAASSVGGASGAPSEPEKSETGEK